MDEPVMMNDGIAKTLRELYGNQFMICPNCKEECTGTWRGPRAVCVDCMITIEKWRAWWFGE